MAVEDELNFSRLHFGGIADKRNRMMKIKRIVYVGMLLLMAVSFQAEGQNLPRVLVVVAHPDDESVLSVTLYKLAKEQYARVDLFVITNGEAGYRYSTLAEQFYGVSLANAGSARRNLPSIRRKELTEAGKILGISHIYFGNQRDSYYTTDEHEPLDTSWQVSAVKDRLHKLLISNHYNMVLCLLPEQGTHGGHKAATLLALDAVSELPVLKRPIILGAALFNKGDTLIRYKRLGDYTLTQTFSQYPSYEIDRTVRFSYKNKINYKVIANWELAAHKSQGATQMTMNEGDIEGFWYFSLNAPAAAQQALHLFEQLSKSPYVVTDEKSNQLAAQNSNK